MNISLSQSLPKENVLLAVFLTNDNVNESNTWLGTDFSGFSFEEKHAKNGAKTLIPAGSILCYVIGLGDKAITPENIRKATHKTVVMANEYKFNAICVAFPGKMTPEYALSITESALLTNYQFLNYKSDKTKNGLELITIWGNGAEMETAIEKGKIIGEATNITRDLVNEPVITLTAEELANRAARLGNEFGFSVDIWNKAKIQSLRMGGLLAVNFGSKLPPTFSILEYKPENPVNSQPIILVGKGVVYDTGGLSLKPTANSMDFMKCDMAGAGAVIGALCGIAKLKLNTHIIGLIPATDNRPGENAYVPGDVITMYDGSTVEVLNTDAEGRMILADALAYAKQYKPELVIDLATLTGASVVAIGGVGIAMMSTATDSVKNQLKAAGETVYERLVEFPLWDEYGEMLKSDIADRKNIGGSGAGAITAGKFLEHFTDYPWIHLDIAGPAWSQSPDYYRGKNGTGIGVRLLIEFISQREKA